MNEAGKLFRRVWNLLAFGKLQLSDDSGPVQTVQLQLRQLEIRDKTAMAQLFGFASNPPVGTDVVVVFVAGDRSNGVGIASNHQQTRPRKQKPGEATVYNQFGMSVQLAEGGIVINGGGKNVTITNAPTLAVQGSITATGGITAGVGTSDSVTVQQHTHPGTDSHGDAFVTRPPTAGT